MAANSKRPWQHYEVEIVREMASTHRVVDIAARLNRTRNMVIAKADREGIPLTFYANAPRVSTVWPESEIQRLRELANTKTADEIASIMGRTKAAVLHRARGEGIILPVVRIPARVPQMPAFKKGPIVAIDTWAALPNSHPVSIMEHKSGCRWPIGDEPIHFCNLPVDGTSSYCLTHRKLGTIPAEVKPRKARRR